MKRLLPSASLAAAMACALALSACAAQPTEPAAASARPRLPRRPAADARQRSRSARLHPVGRLFVVRTNAAMRAPWELAKQKGFANSAQAYEQFCRNTFAK